MKDYPTYKSDEWFIIGNTWDDNPTPTYVDSDDNPITGILEDFFYFKKDDPRNHVKVIYGKRDG
jgi:hypothetical protein